MLFLCALSALAGVLDEPLRSGQVESADAAVVIGNEGYYQLPATPWAHRDALVFHDLLVYTRGIPLDRVRFLQDVGREELLAAVGGAASQVREGGTLWFYFAGHGLVTEEGGSHRLVGIDAPYGLDAYRARSATVDEILAAAGSVRMVLVLDTCFAGQGRDGRDLLVPGSRFAVPAAALGVPDQAAVWMAASAGQVARPLGGQEHGAFTWAVVGAFRGWADGELDGTPDGRVTIEEARAYAQRVLPEVGIPDQRPSWTASESFEGLVFVVTNRLERAPDLDVVAEGSRLASASTLGIPPLASTGTRGGRDAPVSLLLLEGHPGGVNVRERESGRWCTTPCRLVLDPGSYELSAWREGVRPMEFPLTLTPGTTRLGLHPQRWTGRQAAGTYAAGGFLTAFGMASVIAGIAISADGENPGPALMLSGIGEMAVGTGIVAFGHRRSRDGWVEEAFLGAGTEGF